MFTTPTSGVDAARYLTLVAQSGSLRRHVDLLRWLRGDVQQLLPHDIFLAGWGNFEEGSVQHDILSELPGVRSYAPGTDSLPFLLSKFHARWVAGGRAPFAIDFSEFFPLLGSTSLPGTFCAALRTMKSVLVHGLRDQRGRHDCLHVLFGTGSMLPASALASVAVLTPWVDAALRQVPHLPEQHRLAGQTGRLAPDDGTGLSDREAQIMAWVAMGKTNSEIGTILNISGYTVKNHMQRIFQKLNVFNRTQAVSKVTRVSIDG